MRLYFFTNGTLVDEPFDICVFSLPSCRTYASICIRWHCCPALP